MACYVFTYFMRFVYVLVFKFCYKFRISKCHFYANVSGPRIYIGVGRGGGGGGWAGGPAPPPPQ